MRVLESERVIIKPVEQDDLQYLLELRWDKSIMSQLVHNPISMKNQMKWFEGLDNQKNVACVIFFKEGDKISRCGTVGLYNINQLHRRGTWRLRIDPEFQGKGIGSESTKMIIEYGFNKKTLGSVFLLRTDGAQHQYALSCFQLGLGRCYAVVSVMWLGSKFGLLVVKKYLQDIKKLGGCMGLAP